MLLLTWDFLLLQKSSRKSIPLILGGQEIIGIAQTGTGKTAAYLLPTSHESEICFRR